MIPFLRPELPPWEQIEPQIKALYTAGSSHPGPNVVAFEKAICQYTGASEAVMISSCTSGLMLLMAYEARRGTSKVLIPDFTFRGTAQAVRWAGLSFELADVGLDGNLAPSPVQVFTQGGERGVVLGMHCYGKPCNHYAIREAARGMAIYYDAAHALGAEYHGRKVGNLGARAECFSLNITKACSSFVEGGVITTNDGDLAEWIRWARWHGDKPGSLDWRVPGMNAKPTELGAVIALAALKRLDDVIRKRHLVALAYAKALVLPKLCVPMQSSNECGIVHAHKDFALLAASEEARDQIIGRLEKAEVAYKRYFYPTIARMEESGVRDKPGYTQSETLSWRVICLPIYSTLTDEEVEKVIVAVRG